MLLLHSDSACVGFLGGGGVGGGGSVCCKSCAACTHRAGVYAQHSCCCTLMHAQCSLEAPCSRQVGGGGSSSSSSSRVVPVGRMPGPCCSSCHTPSAEAAMPRGQQLLLLVMLVLVLPLVAKQPPQPIRLMHHTPVVSMPPCSSSHRGLSCRTYLHMTSIGRAHMLLLVGWRPCRAAEGVASLAAAEIVASLAAGNSGPICHLMPEYLPPHA